jgi:Pyridoxamine 5'-phosphate oxidase
VPGSAATTRVLCGGWASGTYRAVQAQRHSPVINTLMPETFTGGRGPSIRSTRTSVPKGVPAGVHNLRHMSVPDELIPEHRCWELLATVSVGRLALSVRALPMILPVQYYLDGHRLAICLGHHQIPERSLNDVIIAFAADEIDPVTRSGWSVQVQGRSVIPRQLGVDTTCGWPAAAQVVQMEPGIISGHRTHLCPFIDALLTTCRALPTL